MSSAQLLAAASAVVILALIAPGIAATLVARARLARAQADVETIASAVRAFSRDLGFMPAFKRAPSGERQQPIPSLDLLVGPGELPREREPGEWSTGESDAIDSQLRTNGPGYALPPRTASSGWNGPYIARACPTDPLGNRYMVNMGAGAPSSGQASPGVTWVLSAGPNGLIETALRQPVDTAQLGGDDVGARIR